MLLTAAPGVVTLAAIAGCSGSVGSGPTTTALTTEPATTTTLAPKARRPVIGDLTVEAHSAVVFDPPAEVEQCTALDGAFVWADASAFDFAALPVGCEPEPVGSLNGRLGVFRSSADALDFSGELPAAQTAVGGAEAFFIDYTECTNSCEVYRTPVAVVTLDQPVTVDHVDYDVVNLYERYSDDEVEALYDVLASLQR